MAKNLLIVESPAKAKTIEKYLGSDFIVKSSYGHIRDLEKGKKGINIEDNFNLSYVVSPEKERVVKELKAAAKKVDEVWLATDEDREGEAISWHICEVLGIPVATTKRIVFREITKTAVQNAILKPRTVDIDLVNAQQARRVLDRLVGFELSETLWRKVRNKLSAGRVQSVTVKLVVDQEKLINEFQSEAYYKVTAVFNVTNKYGKPVELKAELTNRLPEYEDALALLERCKGGEFKISTIKKKPLKRYPAAPFTTSTLQQDASRKLSFAVKRTMSAAQKLYEQGNITYMRTDSTSLSELAIGDMAKEIKKSFGEAFLNTKRYKSKDANAQEAHEAIRPTNIGVQNVTGDSDMQRLYELIWKRTIASQMSPAELEKTTVEIFNSNTKEDIFKAEGEVLTFEGFLKVYLESKDDDDEEEDTKGMLPPLSEGQILDLNFLEGRERFTRAPARYTEASLVKKLEELGIGRPSTYAPTISKIMEVERGYVTKESREGHEREFNLITLKDAQITPTKESEITGATSNRLYPMDIGIIVTNFLSEHFADIMDYDFTADVEKQLDKIALGSDKWKTMIGDFYTTFHKTVETTLETADRAKGMRELGVDAESGHTVLTQMTRYGPVVQIGTREEVGEEGKPKFASLKPGQSMESITYEEAMLLFDLPKNLGHYDGDEVEVNRGRFGPYVKHEGKFISLPKGLDPLELSLEEAIDLIEAKRKEDAPVAMYDGKEVTQGSGRFGPFIKWDGMFINIPRKYDPENLSVDDCHELIKAKIEKEANRFINQWPAEKLALENGRWGPFIRSGKKSIQLPKIDGKRMEASHVKDLTLEDVKLLLEGKMPESLKDLKL